MLEIAMCVSLFLMGFYFIKSTDLPKDLKDRSAQLRSESNYTETTSAQKVTFPKVVLKESRTEEAKIENAKLVEAKIRAQAIARQEAIAKLIGAIDLLEKELAVTVERTAEIQKMIDSNKLSLRKLQA